MSALPLYTENRMTATPRPGPADIIVLRPISIRRLVALLDDSDDDEGRVTATQYAFKTAFDLVEEAEHLVGGGLVSSPVVDSEGGIRVTWRRGDKQVKLVCPATREAPVYMYYAFPEGNDLRNQNVTAAVLAERLAWLINCESAAAT
jgi:hypothetical protein